MEVDARAEEADEAAADQPVDRLILAVHGIGQKLSGANIVDDAATLRALVSASCWRDSATKPLQAWRTCVHDHLRDTCLQVISGTPKHCALGCGL